MTRDGPGAALVAVMPVAGSGSPFLAAIYVFEPVDSQTEMVK